MDYGYARDALEIASDIPQFRLWRAKRFELIQKLKLKINKLIVVQIPVTDSDSLVELLRGSQTFSLQLGGLQIDCRDSNFF